jgi:hypothetical protein
MTTGANMASAIPNSLPNKNGPPCASRQVRQIRSIRFTFANAPAVSCWPNVLALDIHRHLLAQISKTRVHLRADAAGVRPRGGIARPHGVLREEFGQGLHDRDRFPYGVAGIGHEARHFPRRRMREDIRGGIRPPKADHVFLERNAEVLEHEPRPHGPRRHILVTNNEFHRKYLRLRHGLRNTPFNARQTRETY